MVAAACSAKESGFGDDGGADTGSASDSGGDSSSGPKNDSGVDFGDSSSDAPIGDGGIVTTVYANTDDTLYSLNPQTNAVTMIGKFIGTSDASNDNTITDIAVNAAGDVYVNSESVVYKANVPSSPGPVSLTKIASISLQNGQKFYALAFTPVGSLDPSNEILIGGDGNGELYSIDTSNGSTKDLGSFGVDPGHSGYDFALSGDLVFYMDAQSNPTGLVTIRPCKPKTTTCLSTSDYLAAVDMTALATAYKNGTPATTLLKGIYGASGSNDGAGTNYGDLFGLGAWQGTVFAFARKTQGNGSPLLLSIDTKTGAGNIISSNFTFTNGWSGAGVSTSATISVSPPN
jgi:hypothetical protein